jgi:hypothetical protein
MSCKLPLFPTSILEQRVNLVLWNDCKDVLRMKKSDLQATEKEKKQRQGEKLIWTQWEEAIREAKGVT